MSIKYVFCIGTGRNGTNYLKQILSSTEGCVAEHEPAPRCNREPMRRFLNGNPGAMKKLMPRKLAQIATSRAGAKVYVETNHAFIKGFGWFIPEFIDQREIAVIIVAREKEHIVESFLRIASTCLSESGRNWLILPTRRNPLVPPPAGKLGVRLTYWLFRLWALPFRHKKYYKQLGLKPPSHVPEQVKAYERECLSWYVDETKALATEYRKRFPEITYINMTLSELNDAAKVEELLSLLGLKAGPELLQRLGVATNTKR